MPKATNLILSVGRSPLGKAESWPLPPEAAQVLSRVAPSAIPILCLACSGTAFRRVASAIHRASGRARLDFVDLHESRMEQLVALPRGRESQHVTLAMDGLEELDTEEQAFLARYLEEAAPRLVTATRLTRAELSAVWPDDLLATLSTVTVAVPRLSQRQEEIPTLAQSRLETLCEELLLTPVPRLGSDAQQALAEHLWPGDVTEFDAVLLATLLGNEGTSHLGAGNLVWATQRAQESTDRRTEPPPTRPTPSHPPASAPRPPPSTTADEPTRALSAAPPTDPGPLDALKSLAVELAHHIKNPLVTVKTFVSNAGRLDEEEMARFGELTLEAVQRIDAPLDQILEYAELPETQDEPLEVAANLEECLAQLQQALDAGSIRIEGLPLTTLPTRGSAAALRFALGSLVRHIAETVQENTAVAVGRPAADQLVFRYRESGISPHLRDAADQPDSSFPLALLLVRGALVRMGASIGLERPQGEVRLILSFAAP